MKLLLEVIAMKYNEIYELVKPIYQWLEEHYPNDKYIKIETSGFSLCEDRTMSINPKIMEGIARNFKEGK